MKPVSELLRKRDAAAAGPSGALWHVRPDDTVFDALKLLAEYEVGALMVMDGARLLGVFSERDYTRKVTLRGRNSKETLVSEIMTAEVVTVNATTRTSECMALMSARKIRHLPVLDGDRVLGMISIRDIMNDIIADHESTIAALQGYITS